MTVSDIVLLLAVQRRAMRAAHGVYRDAMAGTVNISDDTAQTVVKLYGQCAWSKLDARDLTGYWLVVLSDKCQPAALRYASSTVRDAAFHLSVESE